MKEVRRPGFEPGISGLGGLLHMESVSNFLVKSETLFIIDDHLCKSMIVFWKP